jgi:prepilin-type N-terminal cleavage/methylation domain-containing protein
MHRFSRAESAFGLIEILVVLLILAILAGIAIPVFLIQRGKASDVVAKAQVRAAQTAAETYASDHNGQYTGLTLSELQKIEPTLSDFSNAELAVVGTPTNSEFEVQSTVKKGTTSNAFKIKHKSNGEVERKCATEGTGGCPSGGSW